MTRVKQISSLLTPLRAAPVPTFQEIPVLSSVLKVYDVLKPPDEKSHISK